MPLPDGNVLLTYLDVTDSATIERALRERNKALEEADHMKSDFIANMSYEIRAPLNSIIGFTDMMGDRFFGELNERQIEYTNHIREASGDLLNLINSILDLATIEANRMELEIADADIGDLLADVLRLVGGRARRKHIEPQLELTEDMAAFPLDAQRIRPSACHPDHQCHRLFRRKRRRRPWRANDR